MASASATKPSTRSSIRHSLTLSSVGKALADVINKEGRDPDSRKAKEISSRRLSAINLMQGTAVSRTSLGGDTKPPLQKRGGTPDSKTITRKTRRASSAATQTLANESPDKGSAIPIDSPGVPQNVVNTRSSVRRTRNLLPSSALPKYRPKSVVLGSDKKTPSPVLVGSRRRHSSSDDEKEQNKGEPKHNFQTSPHSRENMTRPMSPLPRRLTFKVAAVSIPTSPSVPKGKGSMSPSSKISPPRPLKSVKTTNTAIASSIPRPPSSASSISSTKTPSTPKTPKSKSALESGRSDRQKTNQGSRSSPLVIPPSFESPLARHSRTSRAATVDNNHTAVGNMSHISEGNSEDGEADDVEMLLAPVASLAAPTPAMPRIELTSHRQRADPQTPTRTSQLPTRAKLSYLSPLPPDADDSSPSRRPLRQPGSDKGRGSILSWEQLATEASRTLGEDEIDSMLADIPPPFRSGAVSPSPRSSHLGESPCLSAMHSPGGYGSISQVLLPDVTPSPAIHPNTRYGHVATEPSAVDGATVTLLRLQLVSAENTGKERLHRLQAMEEEIHKLKVARLRDAEELGKQVSLLEERLHSDRDLKERVDEERLAYTASLEDQLRQEQAFRDQAIEAAVAKIQPAVEAAALRSTNQKLEVACTARGAGAEWASVRDLAESELDLIRANREMLSILLAGLDQSQRQLCA